MRVTVRGEREGRERGRGEDEDAREKAGGWDLVHVR